MWSIHGLGNVEMRNKMNLKKNYLEFRIQFKKKLFSLARKFNHEILQKIKNYYCNKTDISIY
jgi:hypothetical protein